MRHLLFLLALASATSACAAASEEVLQARQMLSHYALATCLAEAYPEEPRFTDDARRAAGAYHFMGRGAHRIVQDEDTLDVVHDPYATVKEYILQAVTAEPAIMKQGGANAVAGCLQAVSTAEFQALVRDQDGYIALQD